MKRLFAIAVVGMLSLSMPLFAAAANSGQSGSQESESYQGGTELNPIPCTTPPRTYPFRNPMNPRLELYDAVLFDKEKPLPHVAGTIKTNLYKPIPNEDNAYVKVSLAEGLFRFLRVDVDRSKLKNGKLVLTERVESYVDTTACTLELHNYPPMAGHPRVGRLTVSGPHKPSSADTLPLLGDMTDPLIPIRPIAEAFGAKVRWCSPPTAKVLGCLSVARATLRHSDVRYKPGYNTYRLNIAPPTPSVYQGDSLDFVLSLKRLAGKGPDVPNYQGGRVEPSPPPTGPAWSISGTRVTIPNDAATGTYTVVPLPKPVEQRKIVDRGYARLTILPRTYELDIVPLSTSAPQGGNAQFNLTLKQVLPSPLPPSPYDKQGSIVVTPPAGPVSTPQPKTFNVAVSATTLPGPYKISPQKDPTDTRLITPGPDATLNVFSCAWIVPQTSINVTEGDPLPPLGEHVTFVNGPSPPPNYTPTITYPPIIGPAPQHVAHSLSGHDETGTITIASQYCTPVVVMVTVHVPLRHSLAVDYGRASVYDELSPGNSDWKKALAHAELEVAHGTWISVDARSIGYRHDARSAVPLNCPPLPPAPAPGGAPAGDQGCVTVPGGASQTYRTAFAARDDSVELRAGGSLGAGAPVAELAYLTASNNANRPNVSGLGAALELPPVLSKQFAPYGAISYYPRVSGGGISYHVLRYRAGLTYTLEPKSPQSLFFELAAVGDRRGNASNAPSSAVYQAITLGVGVKF